MNSPFLLYHKVDHPTPDVRIRGAFTSPRQFAIQIEKMRRLGVNFHTASEMVVHYRQHGRFPERGLAITFDDGWRDNYLNAFPVLKRSGIKATIFLIPGVIGRTTDQVTADGEGPREHLSEADIIDMSRNGIEMGSHSFTHPLMNKLAAGEIRSEMVRSRQHIEELTQAECKVFAYPAGFFTGEAKQIAKDAGYMAAFSTCYGPEQPLDLYALNRTEVLRRDRFPFRFSRKIVSVINA